MITVGWLRIPGFVIRCPVIICFAFNDVENVPFSGGGLDNREVHGKKSKTRLETPECSSISKHMTADAAAAEKSNSLSHESCISLWSQQRFLSESTVHSGSEFTRKSVLVTKYPIFNSLIQPRATSLEEYCVQSLPKRFWRSLESYVSTEDSKVINKFKARPPAGKRAVWGPYRRGWPYWELRREDEAPEPQRKALDLTRFQWPPIEPSVSPGARPMAPPLCLGHSGLLFSADKGRTVQLSLQGQVSTTSLLPWMTKQKRRAPCPNTPSPVWHEMLYEFFR